MLMATAPSPIVWSKLRLCEYIINYNIPTTTTFLLYTYKCMPDQNVINILIEQYILTLYVIICTCA